MGKKLTNAEFGTLAADQDVIWLDADGIVHVRNSERGTLNKCPQRWWWSWRDGLRPKETARALWFGEGIHLALAHYYAPGKKRRKDFIDVWRQFADDEAQYVRTNIGGVDEAVWLEARILGEEMLTNYVEEYRGDKHWHVVATEQSFELAVPFGGSMPDSPLLKQIRKKYGDYFILNGTFDGVYYDLAEKRFKLMEHKTAGSISTRHLTMDNQAGTYHLVAQTVGVEQGWLKPKQQIREITYNFLRKGVKDDRPVDSDGYATNKPNKQHYIDALEAADIELPALKKDQTVANLSRLAVKHRLVVVGDRSKAQPAPLFQRHAVRRNPAQRRTQLMRLQDEVAVMCSYVLGNLPVTKSPSRDTCPMCPFSEMCELHESGAGWEHYRDSLFRRTDPYEDHRATRKSA